jgi:hypothetical protein
MNHDVVPTIDYQPDDELVVWLELLVENALSSEQHASLEALLEKDPQARRWLVRHLQFQAALSWDAMELEKAGEDAFPSPNAASTPLPSSFFRNAVPQAAFFQGWPMAYLVATVIVGIGIAIAAVTHVSPPSRTPNETAFRQDPNPQSPIPNPSAIVGRITGMVDCHWGRTSGQWPVAGGQRSGEWGVGSGENLSLPSPVRGRGARGEGGLHLQSAIHLGDQLALQSGLLEITYDTGAVVILQGPVTYEVESAAGGYLAIGKLTARVEKKTAGEDKLSRLRAREPNVRPQALAPLFAITTPTAIVTDLGTEFGVEVDGAGKTFSYVFRGVVRVEPKVGNEKRAEAVQLTANQAAVVEKPANGGEATARRANAATVPFVRRMAQRSEAKPRERWLKIVKKWQSDPNTIVYYTFDAKPEHAGTAVNRPPLGPSMNGIIENVDWTNGSRVPGKSALLFHGPGFGSRVVLPQQERFNFGGPFSIAIWFKGDAFSVAWQTLIAKGDDSWRLQRSVMARYLSFDTDYFDGDKQKPHCTIGRTDVGDHRWHFAVAVYEPAGKVAKKRLYIDGRLETANEVPLPRKQNNDLVCIGCNSKQPGREFQGFIDEVAIFSRALSEKEIAEWFEETAELGVSRIPPQ